MGRIASGGAKKIAVELSTEIYIDIGSFLHHCRNTYRGMIRMPTLGELATIQLGYTARGRLEPVRFGGSRAIQLRDVPAGSPAVELLNKYEMGDVPSRYWVQRGDVLFRSRGDKNTATALSEAFDEPAIAVMPLVILRPDQRRASNQYLAWYINQPDAQRYFDGCARGTSIRMIPVGCLSSLEVPLPDLPTQSAIVETDQLTRQEFELSTRLAERRRHLKTLLLLQRASQSIHQTNADSRNSANSANRKGAK